MQDVRVLIDLDNTIWDITKTWVAILNEKYGQNVDPDSMTEYDISSYYPIDNDEFLEPLETSEFWQKVKPYFGSISVLYDLNKICDMYIVTKTCSMSEAKYKIEKLLSLAPFLTLDQIIITGNKHMIDADVIIDDCLEYALSGDRKLRLLIDKAYNRDIDDDENGLTRVKDLLDAYEIVEKYIAEILREDEENNKTIGEVTLADLVHHCSAMNEQCVSMTKDGNKFCLLYRFCDDLGVSLYDYYCLLKDETDVVSSIPVKELFDGAQNARNVRMGEQRKCSEYCKLKGGRYCVYCLGYNLIDGADYWSLPASELK